MPHTQRVFDHFEQTTIPALKEKGIKSMLYVGWRSDCKPWWHDYMAKELGALIGVLEIFPKNAADLDMVTWAGRYDVSSIIVGDARDPATVLKKGFWDLIFWDHGPEHVTSEDLEIATPRLFDCAGKALLYCCPWGHWPQGAEGGNEHEVHQNSVTVEQLTGLGFSVDAFGSSGQSGEGELVGLKLK